MPSMGGERVPGVNRPGFPFVCSDHAAAQSAHASPRNRFVSAMASGVTG